jgi:transcriptional regulator with XRE-family HTH domain
MISPDTMRLLRTSKKVRQADVAAFLHITTRHYQRIECGRTRLSIDKAVALADFFGVSLDYLCGRAEDRKRKKG